MLQSYYIITHQSELAHQFLLHLYDFFFFIKIKQVLFYHSPLPQKYKLLSTVYKDGPTADRGYFPGLLQCELLFFF